MNKSTKFLSLKESPVFSLLSDQRIDQLAEVVQYERFTKGQKVYKEDHFISCVYVIVKGTVKISRNTTSGKVMIKDIVYDGEVFGENVFTAVQKRTDYAEVLKDVSVLKVPLESFMTLIHESPEFADEVMKVIVERLNALENRIRSFVFDKAKKRIVDFLKRTGESRGIKIGIDECLINHGLSHKEIALITDTSRQTVARVLGELKKDNIIHFSARKPSKILIRNDFGLS